MRQVSVWFVDKQSDGSYIPYIGDAYTAAIDKYLYAILLSDPEPEHWKITSTGENGRYMYVTWSLIWPYRWIDRS